MDSDTLAPERTHLENRAQPDQARLKWVMLVFSALTNSVAVAIPSMAMTVLLPEISRELKLSLVQAGLVWGLSGLPTMIVGVLGGAIGDRFGPRRVLIVSCLLAGLAGALRGTATDIVSLLAMVLGFGLVTPLIVMNNVKSAAAWFPRRELGLANGALAMGMALGFLVGSLVSASLLSPWLGGWRNVFFGYGALAAALAIPWAFTPAAPTAAADAARPARPMRATLAAIARLRNVWLLGLAVMGISGGIQGLLGYLPTYLRGLGWPAVTADSALGAFHTVSLLSVLPIALSSDRLGARKGMLLGMGTMITAGIGLLTVLQGGAIWAAVLLAGVVRDGFMAILNTAVIETKGVDGSSAGTAMGFNMMFIGLGALLAPPLGNALAAVAPGAPFAFWAGLSVVGLVCIALSD
ncbi:MAG: MFS transporter [Anaerolineales bacterium]|nr:MFS transporter [Anaerolineales bacterium]